MHNNNGNANSIYFLKIIFAIFKPQLFVFIVWSKITQLINFFWGLSTLNEIWKMVSPIQVYQLREKIKI
jgi:hypothetical protein